MFLGSWASSSSSFRYIYFSCFAANWFCDLLLTVCFSVAVLHSWYSLLLSHLQESFMSRGKKLLLCFFCRFFCPFCSRNFLWNVVPGSMSEECRWRFLIRCLFFCFFGSRHCWKVEGSYEQKFCLNLSSFVLKEVWEEAPEKCLDCVSSDQS
jgi:hypothetical protein